MFSRAAVFALVLALSEVTGKVSKTKEGYNVVTSSSSSSKDSNSSKRSGENICNMVKAAVQPNARWSFSADESTLQRIKEAKQNAPVPTCQCPTTGGLGDVSKVVVTDFPKSGSSVTDVICTGCPGNEAVVKDVKFCINPSLDSENSLCIDPYGPCSGITVYRCDCGALPSNELPTTPTISGTTTSTYE